MNDNINNLKKRIEDLRKKIEKSATNSGRKFSDIKIVAVTKTMSEDKIIEINKEGFFEFGENKVQELCKKYNNITNQCNWHFIGHLQTNKVKQVIDKITLLHSLDGLSLAQEIEAVASKKNLTIDSLVQVNVSGEKSKYGISKYEVFDFLYKVSKFKNIKIKGLMTIAPNTENKVVIRNVFRELKNLSIDIQKENIDNINVNLLSMGMSNDFEIAIEEGSNIIRIGRLLLE